MESCCLGLCNSNLLKVEQPGLLAVLHKPQGFFLLRPINSHLSLLKKHSSKYPCHIVPEHNRGCENRWSEGSLRKVNSIFLQRDSNAFILEEEFDSLNHIVILIPIKAS